MKYRLHCILFGHIFLTRTVERTTATHITYLYEATDICTKCGLTKEEESEIVNIIDYMPSGYSVFDLPKNEAREVRKRLEQIKTIIQEALNK